MTAELTADMAVAPEIARLAEAILLVPAQPAENRSSPLTSGGPESAGTAAAAPESSGTAAAAAESSGTAAATPLTLGAMARQLRAIAATPEGWWGLVRFEPGRSVKITVEEDASYQAWLVILPPGDAGQGCDCDVATMIVGEATEGTPSSAVLRPGALRVHGQRHELRGRGPGYSISLHARAHRSAIRR